MQKWFCFFFMTSNLVHRFIEFKFNLFFVSISTELAKLDLNRKSWWSSYWFSMNLNLIFIVFINFFLLLLFRIFSAIRTICLNALVVWNQINICLQLHAYPTHTVHWVHTIWKSISCNNWGLCYKLYNKYLISECDHF